MRKVMICKFTKDEKEKIKKVDDVEGIFHEFGVESVEGENCDGNATYGTYSTAIVELKDGTIENVPVEMIRFLPEKKTPNID